MCINRLIQMYRPFRPRFCLSSVTTRLRAWLSATGASRLAPLFTRLKYETATEFQTSLEEAAQW